MHNYAMRSSGSAMPSFCVSELLSAHITLDILLIEYAINDFFYTGHRDYMLDGTQLSPSSTMERLLRTVLHSRPQTIVMLLYVCSPVASKKCEGMYTKLSRHYSLREVSLRHSMNHTAWNRIKWDDLNVHPDSYGHRATALAAISAIQSALTSPRCCCPRQLPAPLHVEPDDSGHACKSCTPVGCSQLQPVENIGFDVVNSATSFDGVAQRFSWTTTQEGSHIGFSLQATHRVMLSLLCSYSSTVGNVTISVSQRYDASRGQMHSLRWSCQSSQQCLVDVSGQVGRDGSTISPQQVVWITAKGGRVQIFAVISRGAAPAHITGTGLSNAP